MPLTISDEAATALLLELANLKSALLGPRAPEGVSSLPQLRALQSDLQRLCTPTAAFRLPDPGIDSAATRRLVEDRNDSALNSARCTNGSEVIYIDSLPSSDVQTSLPSLFPPSLALLTRRPTPAPPPVLGKRSPESRPQEESPPPPVPKIRIPAALNQQVASSGRPQRKSPRKKASPEPSESSSPQSSPPRKRQCKRNGNAPRIGCDEDIGFVRMRIVQDEDGESEAGQDEACDPKNVGSKTKPRGWRTDGCGPPVTIGAGIMLHQLLAILGSHQLQLKQLIESLQKPSKDHLVSKKTDLKSIVADLAAMEADAVAADLLYMCKLVQLALNVDQLRIEAAASGNRKPGVPSLAAKYGKPVTTFQNWHTWGTRLLYLCCAGTFYILPVIACLGLRKEFTNGWGDIVKNLNCLGYSLREVVDGQWRPLVRRFISVVHYLQSVDLPGLNGYRFDRGKDSFCFADVAAADKVLETVETNLFKLPPRASDWYIGNPCLWKPHPCPVYEFADTVSIKLPINVKRTTALPFKKGKEKVFTEQQRTLADQAQVATSVADLRAKLAKTTPGKYVELDPDILGGQTLTIDDASGMRVLTLLTMPADLVQRLKIALQGLDAIIPGEYRWENSRREKYSYHISVYTWYHRMGEKGHGAPQNVHPNKICKPDVKVNFNQRIPYTTIEGIQKSMEFEALVEIFHEVLEFQRINFERLRPETYNEMRIFADILPLNTSSPAYPFAGFMFNVRVATDAHKDSKDNEECEIIFINECTGGELCLYELGLKLNGKTGNILIFPSSYITHFNTHFEGLRASLVLHTDREGGQWEEDGGGWGAHVARHYPHYART